MSSPGRIARHPIYPILIVFPMGLWVSSLVCDVVFYMGWGGLPWKDAAFYTLVGGIAGVLLGGVPGVIDFVSTLPLKKTLQSLRWVHMVINLCAIVIFAVNLWWRAGETHGSSGPMILSVLGVLLLGVSGWLGGSMVFEQGMAGDKYLLHHFPAVTLKSENE